MIQEAILEFKVAVRKMNRSESASIASKARWAKKRAEAAAMVSSKAPAEIKPKPDTRVQRFDLERRRMSIQADVTRTQPGSASNTRFKEQLATVDDRIQQLESGKFNDSRIAIHDAAQAVIGDDLKTYSSWNGHVSYEHTQGAMGVADWDGSILVNPLYASDPVTFVPTLAHEMTHFYTEGGMDPATYSKFKGWEEGPVEAFSFSKVADVAKAAGIPLSQFQMDRITSNHNRHPYQSYIRPLESVRAITGEDKQAFYRRFLRTRMEKRPGLVYSLVLEARNGDHAAARRALEFTLAEMQTPMTAQEYIDAYGTEVD